MSEVGFIDSDSNRNMSMKVIAAISFILLFIISSFSEVVQADVIEAFTGLETGRFAEGVDLSGNNPSASLGVEWSGDSGAFLSLSCFMSENNFSNSIQRGCDGDLGWFIPVSEKYAVTLAMSQHDYSSPVLSGWQYTDVSASWHLGMNNKLQIKGTDSLLGQDANALSTSFHSSRNLSDLWRLNIEAGLISLQNSAPVDRLQYAILGIEYGQRRWSTQLKFMFSSSDYERFVNLEQKQPALSFSIRYRLY